MLRRPRAPQASPGPQNSKTLLIVPEDKSPFTARRHSVRRLKRRCMQTRLAFRPPSSRQRVRIPTLPSRMPLGLRKREMEAGQGAPRKLLRRREGLLREGLQSRSEDGCPEGLGFQAILGGICFAQSGLQEGTRCHASLSSRSRRESRPRARLSGFDDKAPSSIMSQDPTPPWGPVSKGAGKSTVRWNEGKLTMNSKKR